MRSLIIGFVILLAGCNQGTNNVPYSDPALVAKVDDLTKALADATHTQAVQAESISKLQIIGKVHGIARTEGIGGGNFLPNAVNFGPCADMGVLVGFVSASNSAVADPLYAKYQAFKQCTGYSYETDISGNLAPASRLYWDGPNCTGNMWEWNASGSSFNDQSLSNGVVFLNPSDMATQLMVKAGQTSTLIQAVSVYIVSNGDCEADGDLQPMYAVSNNDIQVTGVPGSVGKYNLGSP